MKLTKYEDLKQWIETFKVPFRADGPSLGRRVVTLARHGVVVPLQIQGGSVK